MAKAVDCLCLEQSYNTIPNRIHLWIIDRPDATAAEKAAELAKTYASRHASQESEGGTHDGVSETRRGEYVPKAFETQPADNENLELLKPFMKEFTVNGKRFRVLEIPAKEFTGECAWIRQVAQEHSVYLPLAGVRIGASFARVQCTLPLEGSLLGLWFRPDSHQNAWEWPQPNADGPTPESVPNLDDGAVSRIDASYLDV
ncbi:hypothetical protein HPB52_009421 [Rhipicephalus sanguineus]|uniref:Uncharacterized protein n=1 Tax=Rhipicephalus sanguineus TaxID=34632 RepID=A0A9D4PIQ7_RHISA|nr:hypothetical protein HPB52_009421 [Rhipicephalus sanguineus]